jgi:hypothetical protein
LKVQFNLGKKVAILQSNYIPWKGYFDIIARVDEFILFDEMQYTKRDWRNRNRIKSKNGIIWLTIPVLTKNFHQKICETKISNKLWTTKHIKSLQNSYSKAVYFKMNENLILDLYEQVKSEEYLSRINYIFIVGICKILNIKTKISWSTDYQLIGDKTERIINICQQSGATEYVSGPAAKEYMRCDLLERAKIKLTWMDYTLYREHSQLHGRFEHHLSILDLIFNEGPQARSFMKF